MIAVARTCRSVLQLQAAAIPNQLSADGKAVGIKIRCQLVWFFQLNGVGELKGFTRGEIVKGLIAGIEGPVELVCCFPCREDCIRVGWINAEHQRKLLGA